MRISVFNSRELQGVIIAMKSFDRDLAKAIRRETKRVVEPVWKEAVNANVSTRLEGRVVGATARAQVSDQNVTLKAAAIGRAVGGRVKPVDILGGTEWGANRERVTTYTGRSRLGKTYQVTRHTQRQFRPRQKGGYVAYPAVARVIPRIASLWVQTVVRTFHEATEKR